MRRLFASALPEAGFVALDAATREHVRVLRLSGDEVELFDGEGRVARARLVDGGAEVSERRTVEETLPRVVLLQALPKGAKADEIVRMATELGAAAIRFFPAERSVTRLDAARGRKRVERWERIAREAARQSERTHTPHVTLAASFEEAIDAPTDAARYVAWARGGVATTDGAAEERWVSIGPEGGFTDEELARFDAAGWVRLKIARHILRVDTAAAAALAWLIPS